MTLSDLSCDFVRASAARAYDWLRDRAEFARQQARARREGRHWRVVVVDDTGAEQCELDSGLTREEAESMAREFADDWPVWTLVARDEDEESEAD